MIDGATTGNASKRAVRLSDKITAAKSALSGCICRIASGLLISSDFLFSCSQ